MILARFTLSSMMARQELSDRRPRRSAQAGQRRMLFSASDIITLIVINAVLVVAM